MNIRFKKKTRSLLQDELRLVRSALTSLIGEDREGSYRPEFAQKALKNASELPTHTFSTPETFLEELSRV